MAAIDKAKTLREFNAAVNMSAAELRHWLKTGESRKVGWKGEDGEARESLGHASGRRIVELLGKRQDDQPTMISPICARLSALCIAIAPSARKISTPPGGATR